MVENTFTCNETAGVLFKHPCRQAPTGACQHCRKPVCASHTHPTPHGYMCTSCAKKALKQAKRHGQTQGFRDDPFLLDVFYYDRFGYYGRGHWGHDSLGDDFTEADGESFGDEGGGAWEYDMGAS